MTAAQQPEYEVPLYKGRLGQLVYLLSHETQYLPRGTWARRVLSRGAMVSLVRQPDGKRVLVLSRPKHPRTGHGMQAWANEVNVFLRWFGLQRWEPLFDEAPPPGALEGVEVGVWSAFREPDADNFAT